MEASAVAPGARQSMVRRLLKALEGRFSFTSRANVVASVITVALLGGCFSLILGQDGNWDLRNYHLYNGYGALTGRLSVDLAAAQMQTYFSPLLDMFHYLTMTRLPGPVAGFLFGALHGLLFVPVAGIAWLVLEGHAHRSRLAPLLALAGLCTGAVLSEFGNTMADNSTALFVLASLWIVLREQSAGSDRMGRWLLAGVLLGVAVALKLTNATYAIGIAAAMLAAPQPWGRKLRNLIIVTVSALIAASALAGWWYWQVWQQFGNPLFPQMNSIFGAPLAAPIAVGDTRWLPRNIGEQLIWPLLFTFSPKRVSENALTQIFWALLFVAGIVLLVKRLMGQRDARAPGFGAALPALLTFFLVSYLLWQVLFSIQRYLVALELLAPLLLWCALVTLFPSAQARRRIGWLLVLCAMVSFFWRSDWGRQDWSAAAFQVETPSIPVPEKSVALIVGGDPQAWRIPFLPAGVRYVGAANTFPASHEYHAHVKQILGERSEHFAMFPGHDKEHSARFDRMNRVAGMLGLAGEAGCGKLQWLARKVKGLRANVEEREGRCLLVPRTPLQNVDGLLLEEQARAQQALAGFGVALVPESCVTLRSSIGQGRFPYQWCRLQPAP